MVASDNTPPLILEEDGMGKIHIRKKPFKDKSLRAVSNLADFLTDTDMTLPHDVCCAD